MQMEKYRRDYELSWSREEKKPTICTNTSTAMIMLHLNDIEGYEPHECCDCNFSRIIS